MARVLDSQAIFLLLLTWSFCTAQGIELSLWRTRDRQRTPSREEASHPAIRDLPPPWNSGDPRWYQAWRGGRVTVDLRNDGPTMTGANASFTATLHFPGGQCESSEGDVVWPSMAKNTGGAPVYPELGEQGLNDAYVPPGGRRRRRFVYVWSTRGQQWQQFGRASSKFSLSSDNFALGSYMMVLVVYHHRKSRQYIPIAKASTIYSITNQIPVTVEMRQAQDRLPGDNRFVTGASIDFAANIHDPRRFLAQADLTYTWDFGDESGTLIARVPSATHDYSVPGTYLPRLVVQATISRPCPLTQSPITTGPRTFPSSPSQGSRSIITTSSEILTTFDPTTQQPALDTTMIDDLSTPEVSVMTKVMSSVFPTTNSLSSLSPNTPNPSSEGGDITVLPTITGTVSSISANPTDSSSSSSPGTVEPTNDDATTMSPSTTSDISLSTMGVATSVNTADSVTINLDSTSMTTGTAVVLTYNTASSENFTETSFSTATFDNETTTSATTMNTTDAPAALVLVKRQAPENSECPIYLYGTYRASIDLIEGITVVDLESSFTIVQAANEQSASLDFTVMCNGSIPTEVCTTVADNDCSSPHGQWCRPVPHQADCAIHLQELFNSTGSYCLNVTLVNSQSLALASTEVFVQRAPENISAGMIVGIVIIAGFLLVVLAFTIHRRKHSPQLSATYESFVWMMGQNELLLTLQSFFRHDTAEAEPLLRNCADLNQVLPKGC